jgi:DNA-binding MarR family transcriptional regulator
MSSKTIKTKPRFDCPEQEVYLNLWRTYDRLRAFEDMLFAEHSLSAQQYNAMRLLRSRYPGAMPTLALGQRLISRAPDMTRMLDKLERRGLIRRERRTENRRVVDVFITQAGLDLLADLAGAVQECHRRQLGHLAEEDLEALTELLKRARQPHEDHDNLSIADEE